MRSMWLRSLKVDPMLFFMYNVSTAEHSDGCMGYPLCSFDHAPADSASHRASEQGNGALASSRVQSGLESDKYAKVQSVNHMKYPVLRLDSCWTHISHCCPAASVIEF